MMQPPPHKLGAHIIDARRLCELVLFGTLMGVVGYASFYMVLLDGGSVGAAQAAAYTGIVLAQYPNILSRRTWESVFRRHLFSNKQMWFALILSFVAVATIVTVPGIGLWFGFEPLASEHWLWPVAGALSVLICFEVKKLVMCQTNRLDEMGKRAR